MWDLPLFICKEEQMGACKYSSAYYKAKLQLIFSRILNFFDINYFTLIFTVCSHDILLQMYIVHHFLHFIRALECKVAYSKLKSVLLTHLHLRNKEVMFGPQCCLCSLFWTKKYFLSKLWQKEKHLSDISKGH